MTTTTTLLLGNEKEIYYRFPIILISYVFYHIIFYYKLLPETISKPGLFLIFFGITLHIVHVILIKYLHFEEKYTEAWLLLLIPILVILFFSKYSSYRSKRYLAEIEKIKQQVKDEYENAMIQVPETQFTASIKKKQESYATREMMPQSVEAPSNNIMSSMNTGMGMGMGMDMGTSIKRSGMSTTYDPNDIYQDLQYTDNIVDPYFLNN